jgi:hypothetical protein
MTSVRFVAVLAFAAILVACAKKPPDSGATSAENDNSAIGDSAAPVAAPAPAAASEEPTADQAALALKVAHMDFAMMEDKYINDPIAQWASAVKASSTFGDDNGKTPSASNMPEGAIGKVDGKAWCNNNQDIGFDWLEAGFSKAVHATEVRVVFPNGEGVEAVARVELQDESGKWIVVWSGISDVKVDRRGNRSWFVRSFPKSVYATKAVKVTLANNVQTGYKYVDAVQLVGE